MLQGAHHVDGTNARFSDQEIYFVQANAMLASAGSAKAQGAADKFVIQVVSVTESSRQSANLLMGTQVSVLMARQPGLLCSAAK